MRRLVILGAGGYGRTVADIARQSGRYEEILFLDDHSDRAAGRCEEYRRFAETEDSVITELYPAFGNNAARLKWIRRWTDSGLRVPVLIHPSAYVSPEAEIEAGTVVFPKAVINTGCRIGAGCILNCGAIVDHDCILEDGCHICLGAIIKGENRIPEGTKIEAGEMVERGAYPL